MRTRLCDDFFGLIYFQGEYLESSVLAPVSIKIAPELAYRDLSVGDIYLTTYFIIKIN